MAAANTKPYEIIAGVVDIYVAPVDTQFPDVDETVGTAWTRLGQTDGGVKVKHSQVIVELRTDQVTAPVKAVRSEEGLEIDFALAELTAENYAIALNQASKGMAGGTGLVDDNGSKRVTLYRGGSGVETVAFLARGAHLSPEGDFNIQYEVPSVYQSESPEADFTKDAKALLACKWMAIAANAFELDADDEDIFGTLVIGTGNET
jgi:hypothetical protein